MAKQKPSDAYNLCAVISEHDNLGGGLEYGQKHADMTDSVPLVVSRGLFTISVANFLEYYMYIITTLKHTILA